MSRLLLDFKEWDLVCKEWYDKFKDEKNMFEVFKNLEFSGGGRYV